MHGCVLNGWHGWCVCDGPKTWVIVHNTNDFSINNNSIYGVKYLWLNFSRLICLKNYKRMKECIGACWKDDMVDGFAIGCDGARYVVWLMRWGAWLMRWGAWLMRWGAMGRDGARCVAMGRDGLHWCRVTDALRLHWWRVTDALRLHWWRVTDALGLHWCRVTDALRLHWWRVTMSGCS